jgi:tight adherence protein B
VSVELIAVWSAVCCAVVAVRLLHRQDEVSRRARLLFAQGGRPTAARAAEGRWRRYGDRARSVAIARLERGRARLEKRLGTRIGPEACCVPAGLVLALAARSPLPALAGLLATPFVGRRLRARAARLALEGRQEAVAGLCAALAGELRAGRPPEAALAEAVERLRRSADPGGWGESLTRLLAAARFGGDVPGALRQAADVPGAQGLAGAAACWEVAVQGGAGLADGLDRVAAALRAERDQRDDLRAQLAGPKATAGMLALLPAFGVLLGVSLGADPLRVLFHTTVGLGCLLVCVALEWAGLSWTDRIVRAAEEAS